MLKKLLFVILLVSSNIALSLEGMSDNELSESTGEGIGVIVDNLALYSSDYTKDRTDEDFVIRLDLDGDKPGSQQFLISELRLHRADATPGAEASDSGGSFGNVDNPVFLGDLRSVDVFSGKAGHTGGDLSRQRTTTTVMRSEFPGANIKQINRKTSFQKNPGSNFSALEAQFEEALDLVSDKFSLHWRFDDIINKTESFRAQVDLSGFRFYGTQADVFSLNSKGFSITGTTGIKIDQLSISADQANSNPASRITLNDIDIFTTLGTADQPLTIGSVKDSSGNSQLELEIGALPASIGIAPKSNIYIKSLYFGEKNNPELRTGLRTGKADDGTPENYHYAFQPDIGNTIEIIGMSIQYLRITTLDI